MSGIGKTSQEFYIASYQNMDGSNTSMAVRSVKYQAGKNVSLIGGVGGSTDFNGQNAFMFEGKANYNPDKHVSFQARLRNSFGSKSASTQARLSASYQTNVSKNTSVYVSPYAAVKHNYKTEKTATDTGVFAGVSHNIYPNLSISGEVQKYDGLNSGAENWGVNAILKYTF